jgi:hypothetical protein
VRAVEQGETYPFADREDRPAVPAREESSPGDQGLDVYLDQMGAIPLLDRSKEVELTRRGDRLR